ncbi:alpha/beta hydrolase [Spirillospora albida]|uniref:alpha/beta hydrolase n=1 Tax=Spirillospora albida TaxID=58123 RepID=UPI001FDEAA04|nr:alpha/beta hydrolase [Spirillospora albida]
MKVPLDYDKPSGDTIDLALIRFPATRREGRIGSLLFNFGGPGGDGVDTLYQAYGQYRELNTRYDLIGFDPRGVGRSAPVTCVDDKRMDELAASEGSPDDAAEERGLLREIGEFARACQTRSGRVLPHVGTVSAARDMDVLRAALGDAKLHYFGISYGTQLGASYAHQYPANVGRAVLDGAVDTRIDDVDLGLQQAAAFQRALGDFAKSCAARGAALCPLGADAGEIVASVGRLLDALDARPLPAASGRELTQSLAASGVAAALYSKEAWPVLIQGLTEATRRRTGNTLLMLADLLSGRREDGTYSNLTPANTAIGCADGAARYTAADVHRELPRFRRASPVFGPWMAWGLIQCTDWPVKGDDDAGEVSAPSAAPILVIGNTGDPATPYAWAPALTRELGGKATLLTLKGEGHGAYDTGNACVRKAVQSYLLDGKVPAKGTTCD